MIESVQFSLILYNSLQFYALVSVTLALVYVKSNKAQEISCELSLLI